MDTTLLTACACSCLVFARSAGRSGLVYDGRLVVDGAFKTANPKIFAGGPLTKFSRGVRKGVMMDAHSSRVSRGEVRSIAEKFLHLICKLGWLTVTWRTSTQFTRPAVANLGLRR